LFSADCVAHAPKKFHELRANHGSKVGEQALRYFQLLFKIEEQIASATADERKRVRWCISRQVALGQSNWLFAGSLRAGNRAAAVMSLVHPARIIGHDPYAYLHEVLERLPTHPASRIDELLPHRWRSELARA
jgi:transposase